MSNICMTRLAIKCVSEAALKEYAEVLRKLDVAARAKSEGLSLGSERRFYEVTFCRDGEYFVVDGWVRWGISFDEAREITLFLRSLGEVAEFRLDYEELCTDQVGYYLYRDGVLRDYCVDPKDIPSCDTPGRAAKISQALKERPVVTEIDLESGDIELCSLKS